jgi:thiol-disulfide isomerase/thioredoxin
MMGLISIAEKPDAPDLTLADMAGKRITLSSLKGKIVLLNFWATWCPPCREEMPTLETLYQSFRSRSDFVLLAVDSSEKKDVVTDFLKKTPYSFSVLLDEDGAVSYHYSISAIPTTFLIDAQGKIIAGTRGAFQWDKKEFTDGLKTLLAAKK